MKERDADLEREVEGKLESAEDADDAARLAALEDVHSTLESELEGSGETPPSGH
ncbi:MAG: hypothetical protein M3161_05390 [Actinomycetota bacterium]|nr:hypothetical protein [Actinomycetota bacterium]